MRPAAFAFHAARSVEEALELLERYGEEGKVLAGGQSLVPLLNLRLARPKALIDINGIDALKGIARHGENLHLGALTRHCELERDPRVAEGCPLLAEAASWIGNVRVRSLGTLGGSLAHADPAAELPMALLALDGRVRAVGPAGQRWIPACEFFRGYYTTALAHGELLAEVEVPALTATHGWAIEEFARRTGDFALVAVAAVVEVAGDGTVKDARVALAGVGPTPVRARTVEAALRSGVEPADAAREVRADIAPVDDVHASAAYRAHLAVVLTARALRRALQRVQGREAA